MADKLELHYSLGNRAYTQKVEVLTFSDGTIRVTLPGISDIKAQYPVPFVIKSYIQNMDDVMVIAQIVEIIKREIANPNIKLIITSPIYTRYDRVMLDDRSDAFALNAFSKFLGTIPLDIVVLFDPHSDVAVKQLKKAGLKVNTIPQGLVICLSETLPDEYVPCAPDAGAMKKINLVEIVANKRRDISTGEIIGVELIKKVKVNKHSGPILVIDDICEGGRTFIEVAKLLEEEYPNHPRALYITHGLFTNNALDKLFELYDTIHVHNIKRSSRPEKYPKLFPTNIIEGI